jgi:CO/xanthine dehydrogenase FAD-binding subunit
MRAYLPSYELRAVPSLADALRLLAVEPGVWRPFAGGTDLMVLLDAGRLPHTRYLNLWNLDELRGIEVHDGSVTLGALTTYRDILDHPALATEFPLLCRAAEATGGVATQNRGTIGGNIANASPAADTPPALLVYDAELELISLRGPRRVPYSRFHSGYKQMDLAADELIRAVHLPRRAGSWQQFYRKIGTRRAQAISKVCVAAALRLERDVVGDVRIALGSVAPTPVRASNTEAALQGRSLSRETIAAAVASLPRDIDPIDDARSTARYRLRVAHNVLRAFLEDAAGART